jgi:ketosteroid isomerase-like protein
MAEEDLERLKAVYAELAKGNLRAGFELFAPDISYEPIADGRESLSREGGRRFMREFVAQWDDFRVEAKAYEQLGDTILVAERQSGTGKASGIKIDMTAYAAWTFRDGLVTRVRWSLDRDDAVQPAEPGE